jgi:archaellum component FlaC
LRHNIRHHYKLPLSKKNAQGVLKSLERMEEEIKLIKEEVQNGWDE